MKRDNKTFVKEIRNHLYQYYFNELGLDDWEERVKKRINEVQENDKIIINRILLKELTRESIEIAN